MKSNCHVRQRETYLRDVSEASNTGEVLSRHWGALVNSSNVNGVNTLKNKMEIEKDLERNLNSLMVVVGKKRKQLF